MSYDNLLYRVLERWRMDEIAATVPSRIEDVRAGSSESGEESKPRRARRTRRERTEGWASGASSARGSTRDGHPRPTKLATVATSSWGSTGFAMYIW